jgi:hypothetical protein
VYLLSSPLMRPSESATSVFSFPRDHEIEVPRHPDRLPSLRHETVEAVVLLDLHAVLLQLTAHRGIAEEL